MHKRRKQIQLLYGDVSDLHVFIKKFSKSSVIEFLSLCELMGFVCPNFHDLSEHLRTFVWIYIKVAQLQTFYQFWGFFEWKRASFVRNHTTKLGQTLWICLHFCPRVFFDRKGQLVKDTIQHARFNVLHLFILMMNFVIYLFIYLFIKLSLHNVWK